MPFTFSIYIIGSNLLAVSTVIILYPDDISLISNQRTNHLEFQKDPNMVGQYLISEL